MGKTNSLENSRIALTISPKGIETVAFLSTDREASLRLYSLLATALKEFEEKVKLIASPRESEVRPSPARGRH